MKVYTSPYLFDGEPVFIEPADEIEVCELDETLDGNQIKIISAEGTFLISLIRNAPSTIEKIKEAKAEG